MAMHEKATRGDLLQRAEAATWSTERKTKISSTWCAEQEQAASLHTRFRCGWIAGNPLFLKLPVNCPEACAFWAQKGSADQKR